jgi:hypothetical protein
VTIDNILNSYLFIVMVWDYSFVTPRGKYVVIKNVDVYLFLHDIHFT